MSGFRALILIAIPALAASLPGTAGAQVPSGPRPTPTVPSKSLPASRVGRAFDARGVRTVIVRAGDVEQAEVRAVPDSRCITVSGLPEGGAAGYHSPDPNWRETPAWA